jgi:putative hydrolase of the HAD superfamily
VLVLFDIDDTLLDHRTAERSAAEALHRIAGAAGPVDAFAAAWSEALERHFQRYLAGELSYEEQRRARVRDVVDRGLTDAAADRLLAAYHDAYSAGLVPFPDVTPCLDRLAGHRLGIVSNGQTSQQRAKLVRAGLVDRFECILISEECGRAKPDPGIFLDACARIGEPPASALHIGDRYDLDAEGARSAGLRGIWLDRHGRAAAHHLPPIIASLDQLDRLLG